MNSITVPNWPTSFSRYLFHPKHAFHGEKASPEVEFGYGRIFVKACRHLGLSKRVVDPSTSNCTRVYSLLQEVMRGSEFSPKQRKAAADLYLHFFSQNTQYKARVLSFWKILPAGAEFLRQHPEIEKLSSALSVETRFNQWVERHQDSLHLDGVQAVQSLWTEDVRQLAQNLRAFLEAKQRLSLMRHFPRRTP